MMMNNLKKELMEILSKSEFAELANFKSECSISVYIPTHRSGVAVNEQQDLIVFKNSLQQVRKILQGKELSNTQIDEIIRSGTELLEDETFWYNLNEGLGVFMAKDFFKTTKLPKPVKKEIFVNNGFYVSPLLPVISNNQHFYLLVYSKHDAKFYRGDAYNIEKMEIEGLPNGMNDVIHFEEKGGKELFRGGGNATGSGASFHGHDSGLADEKTYIAQYLKEVDQTLRTEVLANENVPLVLAAVDYLIPLFKQNSSYRYIASESIIGNYEHVDLNFLFNKACEIVKPYFQEEDRKALKTYYDQSATGLTSDTADEIIPASHYGRISDLFVMKDAHIWGKFNEATGELEIHEKKQEDDDCLINQAVIKTLANGGAVHMLDPGKMPDGSKIAAFMRYEIEVR